MATLIPQPTLWYYPQVAPVESRHATRSRLLGEWEQMSKVGRRRDGSTLRNQGLVIRVVVSQGSMARAIGTRLVSRSPPVSLACVLWKCGSKGEPFFLCHVTW